MPGPSALKTLLATAVVLLLAFGTPSPGRAENDSIQQRNQFYRELAARTMAGPSATTAVRDETVLLVSGVIRPGAHQQFRTALSSGTPQLVVLDGPGGVLGEALLIAEEVRRRRLSTLVADNRRCASACAIVFLSGSTKYMGSDAAVGLHSASYADGRADPEATRLMAAYLSQVGVPSSTLRNMARTAPSDIRWLTADEQRAIGIRRYQRQ
jgi:hypothetical protein